MAEHQGLWGPPPFSEKPLFPESAVRRTLSTKGGEGATVEGGSPLSSLGAPCGCCPDSQLRGEDADPASSTPDDADFLKLRNTI